MLCLCRILRTYCFFFFKQKTAYEMRISDWSSDVCSSDLLEGVLRGAALGRQHLEEGFDAGDGGGAAGERGHRGAARGRPPGPPRWQGRGDRKSTRLNSSH